MNTIRWGILGSARIATAKVIPALQRSRFGRVAAIASRDAGRAAEAAKQLGIERSHDSYEALLADARTPVRQHPRSGVALSIGRVAAAPAPRDSSALSYRQV